MTQPENLKESHIDVLIIGAGPAGYMAAANLARTGCNFRIIDKRSEKLNAGQADGLQSRTLETFQSLGFGEQVVREATQIVEMAFWSPDKDGVLSRSARMPGTIPGISRFQEATLHQGRIEQLLSDVIDTSTGGKVVVERPKLPISLEIDESKVHDYSAYPIKVKIESLKEDNSMPEQFGQKVQNGLYRQFEGDQESAYKADAEEQSMEIIHCKYVIGCDGAHSWVRKQIGLEMVGETSDFVWGVLDIVPITNFPDIRKRCAIHSKDNGSIMVIPRENGMVRFYIQLKEVPRDESNKSGSQFVGGSETLVSEKTRSQGRVDRTKITPELIFKTAKAIFEPFEFEMCDLNWFTGYQIGQRVAANFQKHNRVFIAGDACHTHSPKAGQGMNVSMMDTFNLAWKLAYVVKGLALPAILSTYEQEREKNAKDLIEFDHKISSMFSGKPLIPGVNVEGVDMHEFHETFRKGFEFASGTMVDYQSSIIEDKPVTNDSKPFYNEYATKVAIGRRFDTTKVICQADSKPCHIADRMLADGRWRVVYFCGDIQSDPKLSESLETFGTYLLSDNSFVREYTPINAKFDSVIEVLTIHSSNVEDVEFQNFPEALRPRDTRKRMDYWKIFGGVGETYHEGGCDAYTKYGVDPTKGCFIVVRPDGYVSLVSDLQSGVSKIEEFFKRFLISQKSNVLPLDLTSDDKDRFKKPLLAV